MNTKNYNFMIGSLLVSFMLCSPLFIGVVIKYVNLDCWLQLDSKFTFVINVLKAFIASATFFLGVYFKYSVFPDLKKAVNPVWVSLLGFTFLLVVFIPSTTSYFTLKSIISNTYVLSEEMKGEWKEKAITNACEDNNNLLMARLYFDETGEAISYLNKNGVIVKFQPTQEDIDKRQYSLEQENELKRTIEIANRIFFFKILSFGLCALIWLFLLKMYSPRTIIIKS